MVVIGWQLKRNKFDVFLSKRPGLFLPPSAIRVRKNGSAIRLTWRVYQKAKSQRQRKTTAYRQQFELNENLRSFAVILARVILINKGMQQLPYIIAFQ